MTYSKQIQYSGAKNVYVKPGSPTNSAPTTTPSWGADALGLFDPVNGIVEITGMADGVDYYVYETDTLDAPVLLSTDLFLGFISYDSTPSAAQIAAAVAASAVGTNAATAATQATTAATQATAAALDSKKARQFDSNRRDLEVVSSTQWRYTVYEDDGTTQSYQIDYDPTTGAKSAVS